MVSASNVIVPRAIFMVSRAADVPARVVLRVFARNLRVSRARLGAFAGNLGVARAVPEVAGRNLRVFPAAIIPRHPATDPRRRILSTPWAHREGGLVLWGGR